MHTGGLGFTHSRCPLQATRVTKSLGPLPFSPALFGCYHDSPPRVGTIFLTPIFFFAFNLFSWYCHIALYCFPEIWGLSWNHVLRWFIPLLSCCWMMCEHYILTKCQLILLEHLTTYRSHSKNFPCVDTSNCYIHSVWWGRSPYHPHFADEEMKAQSKGCVVCLCHTEGEWRCWDSNPGRLAADPRLLPTSLYCLSQASLLWEDILRNSFRNSVMKGFCG